MGRIAETLCHASAGATLAFAGYSGGQLAGDYLRADGMEMLADDFAADGDEVNTRIADVSADDLRPPVNALWLPTFEVALAVGAEAVALAMRHYRLNG